MNLYFSREECVALKIDPTGCTTVLTIPRPYGSPKVWRENPGSNILIGTARLSVRHLRGLALLDGQTTRVRLPLSRKGGKGRAEVHGTLTAHARLILDKDGNTRTANFLGTSVETYRASPSEICTGSTGGPTACTVDDTPPSTAASTGVLVFSCLTAHDLPQTEGLMFGGQQDPYVKLTLGSMAERSVATRGGRLCEWADQKLKLRVNPPDTGRIGDGLLVAVWNDNKRHPDTLIGRGLVRVEFLQETWQHPGLAVSCRVKVTGKVGGRKGTLSMVATFVRDQTGADTSERFMLESSVATHVKTVEKDAVMALMIDDIVVEDLRNTVALGFGGLDTQEPYIVARMGCGERITTSTSIVRGQAKWEDSCLSIPLSETYAVGNDSAILRLELWNSNPVQDDLVGYADVDILEVIHLSTEKTNSEKSVRDTSHRRLRVSLSTFHIGAVGKTHESMSPGILSCAISLQPRNKGDLDSAVVPITSNERQHRGPKYQDKAICLPVIEETEGPGLLEVTVLKASLQQPAEAPEVRVTLLPGKRFASTRPLVAVGGDSQIMDDGSDGLLSCEWKEKLELPCYALPPGQEDITALHIEVVVAGVLAGQRVLGSGQVHIDDIIRSREMQTLTIDICSGGRGRHLYSVGRVSVSLLFVDAWQGRSDQKSTGASDPTLEAPSRSSCLHSPGILRVFLVEARELSGFQHHQDSYITMERLQVDPTSPFQAKPFCSSAAMVSAGDQAR